MRIAIPKGRLQDNTLALFAAAGYVVPTEGDLGTRKLVFTQGDEMHRPGTVEVEVRPEPTPGKVRGWIGGRAVTVLRGELDV